MKKKYIYSIIIILLLVTIIVYSVLKKELQNEGDIYNISENSYNNDESFNLNTNKNKKVILADILKEPNEFVITEGNVDNTDKIIEKANLDKGVFIAESSRAKFLEIVNTATECDYSISDAGYLVKPNNKIKVSDIYTKINNLIDSDKLIVINISNTYKALLNDMLLDVMIERNSYVQLFQYNDNIKIAILNADKIDENNENLPPKELYIGFLLEI